MQPPCDTSRLFLRADKPGQEELRTVMRRLVTDETISIHTAQFITWLWLVEVHGGDEQ